MCLLPCVLAALVSFRKKLHGGQLPAVLGCPLHAGCLLFYVVPPDMFFQCVHTPSRLLQLLASLLTPGVVTIQVQVYMFISATHVANFEARGSGPRAVGLNVHLAGSLLVAKQTWSQGPALAPAGLGAAHEGRRWRSPQAGAGGPPGGVPRGPGRCWRAPVRPHECRHAHCQRLLQGCWHAVK
jgi:hypothetical protein